MELGSDNKTCQIQSYCAKHLKCSQKCEQDKYNVKCSCYEGWMLEPDGESCRSLGAWMQGIGGSSPCSWRQQHQVLGESRPLAVPTSHKHLFTVRGSRWSWGQGPGSVPCF